MCNLCSLRSLTGYSKTYYIVYSWLLVKDVVMKHNISPIFNKNITLHNRHIGTHIYTNTFSKSF